MGKSRIDTIYLVEFTKGDVLGEETRRVNLKLTFTVIRSFTEKDR